MNLQWILWHIITMLICLSILSACTSKGSQYPADQNYLQPYPENPYYWQINGKQTLLIGASDYHNIFQRQDLVDHLDLLHSVGGNYVRNTMASREILPDHRDLWPFEIVEETDDSLIFIYDLNRWNDEYWHRFDTMLEETVARMMDSELFTFVDISQNNFQKGDLHWDRIMYIREYLSDNPKPITNIKVYGTDNENLNPEFWGSAND